MASSQDIPEEAVEAAIYAFAQFGIEFRAPWQCDLDDPERERYEALCAALAAALPHLPQGEGWRTMESAPHETHVLLFIPQMHHSPPSMEVGFAKGGQRFANGYSNAWEHGYATHWMPLPPLPDGREG